VNALHIRDSECSSQQELKKRDEDEKTRLEQLYLKEQAGRREDQVRPATLPWISSDSDRALDRCAGSQPRRRSLRSRRSSRACASSTRYPPLSLKGPRRRCGAASTLAFARGAMHTRVTAPYGPQARRESEDEYRRRLEAELERISGGARLIDQLRGLIRDVDGKMTRCNGDYLSSPGYQPEDDGDDDDNFFLG
jgi:hypothetical protein